MEDRRSQDAKTWSLVGKDEMNLIEFPFGPITPTSAKTFEVKHQAWDRRRKRQVSRRLLITGSDAFGLPRPIDDQVLVAMQTLTHEAQYASRKVEFSRYQLCRVLDWEPDGRAYARLEESFDRIAGTTLKFKDAWWDKGEKEWKSKTFHLIEEVDFCSRDRLDRTRAATRRNEQRLCSFVWSDVIWKSFQDGFIRTLDMPLFRRIAAGRRREVPLRLFRILDKRFFHSSVARFDLRRLCVGTLGLCDKYSPSQMKRILDRAVRCLTACDYLERVWYGRNNTDIQVYFKQQSRRTARKAKSRLIRLDGAAPSCVAERDSLKEWLSQQRAEDLLARETAALQSDFGTELERRIVRDERDAGVPVIASRRIRQEFVRRYIESVLNGRAKRAEALNDTTRRVIAESPRTREEEPVYEGTSLE